MTARIREGDSPTTAFGSALRYWRQKRELSQRALAPKLRMDHTKLSRLETGKAEPTRDELTLADRVLRTGGALIEAYQRQRTRHVRPRQLPAAPGWLVGRDAQLTALDSALAERRGDTDAPLLVVIDGPAGAGKTALALRWAHRVAPSFPDGQLHVDLKGFAPEDERPDMASVLYDVCQALGVSAGDIPDTLEARAALYRSLMAGTRRLVMLDNVATTDQVRLLLPGSPDCAVVVTSRRVLSALAVNHEAHRVPVGLLTPEDSASLITHFVGHRALEEKDAVGELSRLCGYLPLALRVATQLAVTYPARSLADLAEEIGAERLDALDTDENAPRVVFSWTYRDLPEDAARVYRLIGLQCGRRISVPAIAALAGITVRQARAAVRQLRAVHLLDDPAPGEAADVVGVHDLLHAYAAELVDATETPADREAARHRLILWTLHTVRAAGQAISPDSTTRLDLPALPVGVEPMTFAAPAAALAWCDREKDNLQSICHLAATHGPAGTAWRLAVALWDWLVIRRPWDAWRDTHLVGIRAAAAEHDRRGEAWVRSHLAEALRRQGHLDAAREHSDRALDIHRDSGDDHGQAWAVLGAAAVALDQGDLDRAQDLVDTILQHEHSEQLTADDDSDQHDAPGTDLDAYGIAHVAAARIMSARGEHDRALRHLRQADTILSPDSAARRHHLLPALAEVNTARGDLVAAVDALERAADAHAAVDDWCSEAAARARCGETRAQLPEGHPARDPVPDWTRARDLIAHLGEHYAITALEAKIRDYDVPASTIEPSAC